MLWFVSSAGLAQTFSFGVQAGVPMTDNATADRGSKAVTERYIVGPTVELHLPFSFVLSADFLYERSKIGLS